MAVYELDLPARCPSCREPIRELRVLKLSRRQVAFTSTLPRTGTRARLPALRAHHFGRARRADLGSVPAAGSLLSSGNDGFANPV